MAISLDPTSNDLGVDPQAFDPDVNTSVAVTTAAKNRAEGLTNVLNTRDFGQTQTGVSGATEAATEGVFDAAPDVGDLGGGLVRLVLVAGAVILGFALLTD